MASDEPDLAAVLAARRTRRPNGVRRLVVDLPEDEFERTETRIKMLAREQELDEGAVVALAIEDAFERVCIAPPPE